MSRTGRRVAIAGACIVALLVGLLLLRHLGERDVRRLEAAYLATRQPTACATQALTPGAFSTDQSQLTQTVARLVVQALNQATAVREQYRHHRRVLPLPYMRASERDIAKAMDAEVTLYDAMVRDQTHTDDLLHRLGRANTRAEHHLARVRDVLA